MTSQTGDDCCQNDPFFSESLVLFLKDKISIKFACLINYWWSERMDT